MHLSPKEIFFKHIAQTSPAPLGLEIDKAEDIYIYDTNGNKYIDFISGIAVSSVGHQHPEIKKAIVNQLNKYAHIMVYGETIQQPQTDYIKTLMPYLPDSLDCIYFVNSGAEAIEGAMKLSKAYTQRSEIISFENAYHGSTQGALSIAGNEWLKTQFRPLIPGNKILPWNNIDALDEISNQTAAVFIEPIRGEAGVQIPSENFIKALRKKCNETGSLLVMDEIQTGFGRTGKLFAFEHFGVVPDILVLGKAMGGGLPIGAFIAHHSVMQVFTNHPLGHLTTFGGNAVCVASALASLKVILENNLIENAVTIEKILKEELSHPLIKEVRVKGAMCAVELESEKLVMKTIENALKNGLMIDWFLFAPNCIRIAPPLIISNDELKDGIRRLIQSIPNEYDN
ncbi:MAG TPA: aspartate aminotransferase family protein [Bacteroidia bacterium]|nr:aspartate aminotransferase family protein [Bacteroidia bacterium]